MMQVLPSSLGRATKRPLAVLNEGMRRRRSDVASLVRTQGHAAEEAGRKGWARLRGYANLTMCSHGCRSGREATASLRAAGGANGRLLRQ